jgi:hypothetical protein
VVVDRPGGLLEETRHGRTREQRKVRLAQVQGDLQARLNGLATAFDASVELCDLREELRAFEPVADARNRARRIVRRLGVAVDLVAAVLDLRPDGRAGGRGRA